MKKTENERKLKQANIQGCACFCSCLLCSIMLWSTMAGCANAAVDHDPESLLGLLIERALPEGPEGRIVYASKEPVTGGSVVNSWKSTYSVPDEYGRAWFFFIDDAPGANWEHPCRYIFMDISTKDFIVINSATPPKEITKMRVLYQKQ